MKRIFGFIFVSLFVNVAFADSIPDLYSELNCTDFGCGTAFPKCDPNTFSIAYDAGGGAGNAPMTPVSCKYGEECLAPENTYVRDNYTFLHWICKKSDNTDCEQSTYYTGDSISTATTTDNDTITLTANWMIDGFYSIKYNMLGGALSAELSGSRTDSCNQESDIIELPTLTRANSRFEGWYTDSKFATKITEIKTGECSGDMELYAKWSCDNGYKSSEAGDACTEIIYAITYNLNGGTNTSRNPETYKITDNTIILVHPTRANSTFDGWYADAEFTTKIESIDSGSTGDQAVYAKWSCNDGYAMSADGLSCIGNTITIVYNTDGGTAVESTTCTYGETFTITSTTSKTGYTFSGWKFVGDNIVKDITTEVMCDNSLLGIYEGSYTTVAQWTANNYNVTYYCVDDSTTAKKEENVDFDSEYTVAQSTCEKVGYTFAGWAVSDTETVVNPDDKFVWNYTEDKTLTAQWALNSYECSAGQYLPAGATECATCMAGSYCVGGTYNYDTSKAQGISECPADFREGSTGLESEGACMGSCTVSCEPKTCPEHSTNCVHGTDTESGTMTYGNQSCSATAPVCSMTFDCVDGYNKSGDGCVAGDMNTITYDEAGGKINGSKVDSCNVESGDIVLPTDVTKTGYTFAGWYDANGAKVETIASGSCVSPITLTAQWTLNSYECVAGQYLPAGATECEVCPAGSYCVGGTYNYDTSKAQGISECPADFREGSTGLESEGACMGNCTVECEQKTCPSHSTNCVHGTETATGTMTYGNQSCSATAPVCSMTFDCVDGYNKSGDGCVAGDMNTITYNTDGGKINGNKVDSCNVESGDIVLPTDVTKTGYTFAGWYDANGAKVETIASGSCVSPITLTAQWTACPVCNAGTGATCELGVVNNQCVYTTGCKSGYYNEQGSGTTNPSCESCVKSCSGNSNGFTLGEYNVCNGETAAQCYRACVASDVKGSSTVSGTLSAGGTNTCVATSCASNNYLSGGTCIACNSGFSSPNNNTGGITSCTKTCEVSCSGYAECPENATCEYDTNHKTSGTQTQGGKCSVDAEECPLVDFTCNDGYSKTADGNACESVIFSVIYHLDGGINYNGAPTSFDAKYGVSINGKPTKAGYEFVGWSRFEDLSHPSNGVGVLPDAATGDLHVWAIWLLCPSGSYCDGVRYLCPETHPSSVVGSATISACYKSCEAIEQDNTVLEPVTSKAYYPNDCKYISETTCKPGFEKKNGKCVPCSYDDNVLTYTKGCEIESCVSGYHPNGDKCDSDTISCSVSHAVSAVQKWNSVKKAYDKCMIAECDDGYHIDANACVPDEESCEIANGTGVREWNHRTNSWGECIATRCDPGYTNDASQTNEAWNQCGRCNNAYSAGGELAVSSYVNECEIASCLYQGELYALENNECRLICEEYSDETGRRYWDSSRKKCVHDCADGYTSW